MGGSGVGLRGPMARIIKSDGLTESEKFLARLAERSFLSLWSYPNVYRDVGKELCDLFVVCGRHVILFSDKSIEFPNLADTELAWSRWYRRAIAESSAQLHRAIGWVKSHPDRLFLNAQCSERFPIELPTGADLDVHGIIVARGASRACIRHFSSGSGSLGLMPLMSRTTSKRETPPLPFFVGNPSPDPTKIYHILDDVSLQVLLTELDTISDFTAYLRKKERLILGDHLVSAHGEEDLLSIYLKDINEDGDHDFVSTSGTAIAGEQALIVEGGSYATLRKRKEYRRKKAADRISYVWDDLIESFAKNIINDSTYFVRGYEEYHSPSKRELGLRHMALVPRLERRTHGIAIKGAFERIGTRDRFFRAMLPGESYDDRSTGFFILLVKRDGILKDQNDEDYRRFRANLSLGYALNLLREVPFLERVIGLATEGELRREYRSEDIVYAEQLEWTPEQIAEVKNMAEGMEIFKSRPFSLDKMTHIRPFEYPPSHHPTSGGLTAPYFYIPEEQPALGNRKARRARLARDRKGLR